MQGSWIMETDFSSVYQLVNMLHRSSFRMEAHTHDYWQIILVTKGQLLVSANHAEICLLPGMVHLLPPGQPHALSSPEGYSQFGIDLRPAPVSAHNAFGITSLLTEAFPLPTILSSDRLFRLTTQIAGLYPAADPLAQVKMQNLLDALLLHCIDLADSRDNAAISFERKWAQELTEYLDANLTSPLRLSEIAAHFYISVPSLERRCRAAFQCSVIHLLKQQRFRRAQQLLISTELPIREVGAATGYPDAAHFSDFFRSMAGVSPRAYRSQSRKYA